MSRKVLVVDDEKLIVKGIRFNLEQDGMEVDCAYDGEEAVEKAKENKYDIILLDLMLPKMDGLEVCQQIREFSNVPIVMLTAKGEDMDKILGLDYGADDYITKPFSPSEMVARVKAHMARYERLVGSGQPANEIIEIRGLKIDKTARRVWVNGEEKTFTTKEFDLLTFLAQNPNHVFTKEELEDRLEKARELSWQYQGSLKEENAVSAYAAAEQLWSLWDKELNLVYGSIRARMSGEEAEALRISELEWMKERDQAASKAADASAVPQNQTLESRKAMAEETRARCYELMEEYEEILERTPDGAASGS